VMEFLLDTDTISYYSKSHSVVTAKIAAVAPERIFISVISALEIDYGYAVNHKARERHEHRYKALLEWVNLIDFTGVDALVTAKIRAERHPHAMGRYDALLAGTALARDLILVTNNTKHFDFVPGLKLANWTQA
jgi:tRNA(fMet)-specific endonuclease VapC